MGQRRRIHNTYLRKNFDQTTTILEKKFVQATCVPEKNVPKQHTVYLRKKLCIMQQAAI
jgi:hypothetical protein